MSDQPDPTTIAGVVAAIIAGIGAAWAAVKRLGGGATTAENPRIMQLIEDHEARLTRLETLHIENARERLEDREEQRAERVEIFDRLLKLDQNTSKILAILDERKT